MVYEFNIKIPPQELSFDLGIYELEVEVDQTIRNDIYVGSHLVDTNMNKSFESANVICFKNEILSLAETFSVEISSVVEISSSAELEVKKVGEFRLRLFSDMDNFTLGTFDGMTLGEVDYIEE